MIIDIHTHVVPPRIKQDRAHYAGEPLFAMLYADPKAKLATAEDLITAMDKDGVDMAVALNIGWSSPDLCSQTNDYIMESVARYPQRLVGFGTVSLERPDAALREIERCAAGGMKGIGEMRLDRQFLNPTNAAAVDSFIERIIANNLVLLLHCSEPVGHAYPGKGDTTPDAVYPVIARHPPLRLVCAHWGGGMPFYALMPEVKKTLTNVYFDTAASPYLYQPQIYRQVIQILGSQKVLFGSDYPLLKANRLLREIRSLELPQEAEESVLSGNAMRLLGIGQPTFPHPGPLPDHKE
jgi:predicted TIM-barrel fold metal-dependent hydrolase